MSIRAPHDHKRLRDAESEQIRVLMDGRSDSSAFVPGRPGLTTGSTSPLVYRKSAAYAELDHSISLDYFRSDVSLRFTIGYRNPRFRR